MRYWVLMIGLAATVGVGCSGSPALNTAPLTEEEKQKIREEDKRVEDDERGGSGTATPAKKKRR
ncbi:MAG TPA: hypothetical protein VM533_08845 [Fimbriiglobus sp.]|jgi:hypothetical protein|nr:hypothetical protein [Fimbriiglobus sp.]